MAAVLEFALPDLGEGLTSAEIVRWMVGIGDVIVVDQPVAEVETAKAVVEVPCPHAGVVTALAGPPGTAVPVGTPLITVTVDESAEQPADGPDGPDGAPGSAGGGSGRVLIGYGPRAEPAPASRAGRASRASRVDRSLVGTTAPESLPSTPPVPMPPASMPTARDARQAVKVISPLVRRLARDNAVDLRELTGTGPDGLIRRRDVEAAITAATRSGPAPRTGQATAADVLDPADPDVVPLSPLARRAAEAFGRSRREVPDATTWVDADATELLAARDALNAGGAEPRIGVLALLARVCVAALRHFPDLNSTVVTDADGRATGVRRHRAVHLGFAAQTPRGLVVPVVRDTQGHTTASLAAEVTRLTAAARAGRLTPAELTGGTFTLNNYGVFGVDGATPIVNHPEVAMIGIGRILPRPWAVDGELAVRRITQLSFTFDHRVCDGATAGAFLRFVADAVENPTTLLRHL
ncbi:branched-chain alpha-keto acid dehydrogenase subunit E2 [Parafrankia soli]|uniref:Dihydrolipoamide acetyltransferase component of pyruvate dehydrogenase complex n=1 Tax=Parafrankia soli TaxID=2599596 RepID=A0A1S1PVS1_9ACTN|nr:dihydrolipoamide acetyltransferase family protein [Parafrankia soli]OHV24902.1 branched-chain alpha-keto acid dehydrogenase subunit E2 [Parafrankia soli]